jgi:hypothetical protein
MHGQLQSRSSATHPGRHAVQIAVGIGQRVEHKAERALVLQPRDGGVGVIKQCPRHRGCDDLDIVRGPGPELYCRAVTGEDTIIPPRRRG